MAVPYYTLESLEAASSVGFLLKRCGVLMTQIAEDRFKSQPISFTQWIILMWLAQRPHASPTELSAHLGHDMGALTRVVDELERNTLVRRERSPHDRRAVQIVITPEGRRLAQAAKRALVDLLNELVEPYSRAETEVLISLLQRLLLRMQAVAGTASPADLPSCAPDQHDNRGTKPSGVRRSRAAPREPRRKLIR